MDNLARKHTAGSSDDEGRCLSAKELADCLAGIEVPPERASHADTCANCRGLVDSGLSLSGGAGVARLFDEIESREKRYLRMRAAGAAVVLLCGALATLSYTTWNGARAAGSQALLLGTTLGEVQRLARDQRQMRDNLVAIERELNAPEPRLEALRELLKPALAWRSERPGRLIDVPTAQAQAAVSARVAPVSKESLSEEPRVTVTPAVAPKQEARVAVDAPPTVDEAAPSVGSESGSFDPAGNPGLLRPAPAPRTVNGVVATTQKPGQLKTGAQPASPRASSTQPAAFKGGNPTAAPAQFHK